MQVLGFSLLSWMWLLKKVELKWDPLTSGDVYQMSVANKNHKATEAQVINNPIIERPLSLPSIQSQAYESVGVLHGPLGDNTK